MSSGFLHNLSAGLACLALLLLFPFTSFSENPAAEHVKVDLVSEQDAIVPGRELTLGFRFALQAGWHTYWINPGDSGEPARIEWELPKGFQAGPIQWPYPERLSTPPFVDYGYEREVLLMVALQTPSGLTESATEKLAAHVRYLVCSDVCIPGQTNLELTLPVKSVAAPASAAPLFATSRKRLPQPMPGSWRISASSLGDEFFLTLRTGKGPPSAEFLPLHPEQIENAAAQHAAPIPGGIRLHLKQSKHLLTPIARLEGLVVVGAGKVYLVNVAVAQPSKRPSAPSNHD
jgi:DsbC/DsbD-like thiol-disulfide interchange protein